MDPLETFKLAQKQGWAHFAPLEAITAAPAARWRVEPLVGDAGFAQAVKSDLDLGEICRIVTHRRPRATGAGKGEDRIERETDLDRRARLVKAAEVRECGPQ